MNPIDTIQDHLEQNNLMPTEQKGIQWKTKSTKDEVWIDKMVLENCKQRKTNLHMAWIEYKKAFASLQHNRMLPCLEMTEIGDNITLGR